MSKLISRFGSKRDLNSQDTKCIIRLLDDEEVLQTSFQADSKGQQLLDYVFKTLNLLEKDYFGLRYSDPNNQRTWLDPTRNVSKQVKGLSPVIFCFRVKFYPANPNQLKEEITRYYLYLQLRRDLLQRRLYCLPSEAVYLIACVIQSELGDYDEKEHKGNYISDFKLIPNQNEKLEFEAINIHQNELRNLTPAAAELNFLERACKLETYGIEPHAVKDHKKNQLFVGFNHYGILAFQGNKKVYNFKWNELQKITYEGKMFIVHHLVNGKKNLIGFKCSSVTACQNMWRCAIEQRYFFTMNSSNDIPSITTGGGLFSRQCKLRYSGRVEKEIIEDMKKVNTASGSTINRRHSINNGPLSLRSIGRSNTAPLPDDESPDFLSQTFPNDKNSYQNHSTSSAVQNSRNQESTSDSLPVLHNYSIASEGKNRNSNDLLEKFNEEEDWETSMNSSLPTEFNLRPDLTPTGEEPNTISFETPVVRSSPSQLSHATKTAYCNDEGPDDGEDSDETLEQVSEIVDQTPSTYQQQKDIFNNNKKLKKTLGINVGNNSSHSAKHRSKMSWGRKLAAMLCTSLLSTLIIVLLCVTFLIIILEFDWPVFDDVRKVPEIIVLDNEYYRPARSRALEFIAYVHESAREIYHNSMDEL